MQTIRNVLRILGYGIICVAVFITGQLYWYGPWRLDPLAFLIQPIFLLSLPLLIAGFAFTLQRTPSPRSLMFAAALLLISLSSAPYLLSFPSAYIQNYQKESYQILGALEAWYIRVAIPFWFGCFMSIWPLRVLLNSSLKRRPQ